MSLEQDGRRAPDPGRARRGLPLFVRGGSEAAALAIRVFDEDVASATVSVSARYHCQGRYSREAGGGPSTVDAEDKIAFDGGAALGGAVVGAAAGLATGGSLSRPWPRLDCERTC